MSISRQDAAAALRDIEDTESRSVTLREYQHAAPHFLIWGIIWAVGYGLSDVFPRQADAVWAALVGATILSWELGGQRNVASDPQTLAGVVILVVAFVKVRLIGLYFMELRTAPVVLRLLLEAYVLVACCALIGLYLLGR